MTHPSAAKSLAVCLALVASAAARAQSVPTSGELDGIWRDATFLRQFVAGYGVNAEIEPRVTKDEVAVLEKIRPMMAVDLAKAETALKGDITPESSAMLDFTLGGIQFQQDRLPEALDNHRVAVAKFPSFRRAWRNLGFIHARLGNHDETIRCFTKFVELGGGDAYAYGLLGYAHAQKQDYQPAEAAFRSALLLQPENTQWRLGLVQCVLKQQKWEDASALLHVLVARHPDKAEFWLYQAHALMGLKQPLRAAENLEVVDRLGKSTVDSLFTLGDIYLTEGLPHLAAPAYQRAIQKETRQPIARPMRAAEGLAARALLPQARLVAACIREHMAKNLDAADQRRLLKLEARFSMAEGDGSPEVVARLDEIVKLDPLDGEALLLLGKHYGKKAEPDRAIFYYERAASIEAFEVEAKVRHAQVLVGLSRYAEALPLLRRAQQVKPREEIARYLEQVERVARSQR
ncbi:MAG TPA: tetratricopeptide repeat protein [Planctomycetota bacterium]